MPSGGRSDSLAMLLREGVVVCFKSCSNTHIIVVVQGEGRANPWRATSFYGHHDTSKRYISWKLLVTLKKSV